MCREYQSTLEVVCEGGSESQYGLVNYCIVYREYQSTLEVVCEGWSESQYGLLNYYIVCREYQSTLEVICEGWSESQYGLLNYCIVYREYQYPGGNMWGWIWESVWSPKLDSYRGYTRSCLLPELHTWGWLNGHSILILSE